MNDEETDIVPPDREVSHVGGNIKRCVVFSGINIFPNDLLRNTHFLRVTF